MANYSRSDSRTKTAEDCYAVLGVDPKATKAEVAAVYRQLVKQFHPDKNLDAGAVARFKEIDEAFRFLNSRALVRTVTKVAPRGKTKVATRIRKKRKWGPSIPYDGFPLTAHKSGKWMKKIRGHLFYFGRWGNVVKGKLERIDGDGWKEALALYKAQADDLHAGRTPRAKTGELTVKDLANSFLTEKLGLLESGEIVRRTFDECRELVERMVSAFGKDRLVSDLGPIDFRELRQLPGKQGKPWGPARLSKFISCVKAVFNHASENELIDKPVNFGSGFKRPTKKVFKHLKATQGKKLFSKAEIHSLLDAASPPLKAMTLLGINCGYGNSDVADLQQSLIDWEHGWLDYSRGKTDEYRRSLLWPETREALKAVIALRPMPKDEADADCVFITRHGHRYVRLQKVEEATTDPTDREARFVQCNVITEEFGKLLKKLKINGRVGLGFYSLRHTFATIALQTPDRDAVKILMGHSQKDMLAIYNEGRPSDERLKAVTDHVHDWLFGTEGGAV